MNNYFFLLVDMFTYCENVLLFTCTTLLIYNYKIYYFRWQLPHKRRSYPDMPYAMLKTTYYITKWQSFATSLSLPPQTWFPGIWVTHCSSSTRIRKYSNICNRNKKNMCHYQIFIKTIWILKKHIYKGLMQFEFTSIGFLKYIFTCVVLNNLKCNILYN